MTNRVLNDSSIWDLHIHTCNSPKSSGEFQKMDIDTYINTLLDVFKDYPELSLISFTDHNIISYDVYKAFIDRKTDINIIPGIEIDVDIDGIKDSKHMLFYFNIDLEKLEDFSKKINDYMNNKKSVKIENILDFLISNKIEFIISPHAFKQGKRGIEYDWNDEDSAGSNAHKFMDQLFCFWEASGHSDIANAIEFLRRIDKEDIISVISFSDSSDEKKLREYLSNPPQYFKSLPNYKGLQLAGTDCRRILKEKKCINEDNTGNFIGSVFINGEEIKLSDRLNTIVGGRGSGKSLLLDNMALSMDSSIRENKVLKDDRIDFLDTINIQLKNLDGTIIDLDNKKIDFFDQSYVSKIFSSNNISEEIETYFADEFKNIENIDKEYELQLIKSKYEEYLKKNIITKPTSNISNFVGKYKKIDEKSVGLKIRKTDIHTLNKIDYSIDEAIKYANNGCKLIPKDLKGNKNINNALLNFIKVVTAEAHDYNNERIKENLEDIIKEKCLSQDEEKNKELKVRNTEEELFVNHLKFECDPYVERTNIVNSILKLQVDYKEEKNKYDIKDGVDDSKFKFEKKIIFESPLQYFRKMCEKYIGVKTKSYSDKELYHAFIYEINDLIKDSKTVSDFICDLKSLKDYEVKYESNILYGKDIENLENIVKMSPGTQTNILMEYIVSKQTEIPLLIDQPEDNIDNETIYTKLTEWFEKLKLKRQVIVVTHDANIVINADAENVIIASKNEKNEFTYTYGALEYNGILERISVILDGGVEAVERRLKKYGRKKDNINN